MSERRKWDFGQWVIEGEQGRRRQVWKSNWKEGPKKLNSKRNQGGKVLKSFVESEAKGFSNLVYDLFTNVVSPVIILYTIDGQEERYSHIHPSIGNLCLKTKYVIHI